MSWNIWCKGFREGQQTISCLHDNVRPYFSSETKATLKNLMGNVRTPSIQSGFVNLSPFEFQAFRPLKSVLRFYLDDEVKEAGKDFLKNQPPSF
ncbi:hypothetical protein TNCV_678711 [Trichonephila clavipes]|nr:hypothetical protein TNCV_678711 [Trichonephila clavipes]